ncbi:putative NADH-cytochrome b5 reductase [Viridothelium virens]|uniref:NADH-cytochrome b5 reductase n=1 Tax=Viridothelium virens TaxID=1048519 RepID=A0A6A6H025_VIRVR|nr:putative NADH-cytochrome b5 reductase [Viridothelium virens]
MFKPPFPASHVVQARTSAWGLGGLAALGVTGAFILYQRRTSQGPAVGKPGKVFNGMGSSWVELKLAESEDINHNVKRLRFKFPNDEDTSGLSVNSAILTSRTPSGSVLPTLRPYTPTSDETQKGFIEFTIKRYPGKSMSSYIHNLKPGDTLSMKGPLPGPEWKTNMHHQVGLIAGGAGITPCYQLVRRILNDPNDKTKISLLYSNHTEEDILLKQEFDQLAAEHGDQFNVHYTVSQPSASWTGDKGRITREILERTMPKPSDGNVRLFVCGPDSFYTTVSGPKAMIPIFQGKFGGLLKEMGYTQNQVEKF